MKPFFVDFTVNFNHVKLFTATEFLYELAMNSDSEDKSKEIRLTLAAMKAKDLKLEVSSTFGRDDENLHLDIKL